MQNTCNYTAAGKPVSGRYLLSSLSESIDPLHIKNKSTSQSLIRYYSTKDWVLKREAKVFLEIQLWFRGRL